MPLRQYFRIYHRFPFFTLSSSEDLLLWEKGILTNLSLTGSSVMCDREVLRGSDVRVSVLLPDQAPALSIDLGTVKWVQGCEFWGRVSSPAA